MNTDLFLYEEIMLLSLKDEEGTIEFGAMYHQGLAGAMLAELLLSKRISVVEKGRKKHVHLVSSQLFGDPLLDECIALIRDSGKDRNLQHWIQKFSGIKDLKNRAAKQLCKKGILKEDEDRILLVFSRKIYPEVNPEPERNIIDRLRNAIFTDNDDIDPETVVLVSLAETAGLLKNAFDKKELKSRKKRIKDIANGDIVGKATKEAVEAVQAAIMVACIVPVMVAST